MANRPLRNVRCSVCGQKAVSIPKQYRLEDSGVYSCGECNSVHRDRKLWVMTTNFIAGIRKEFLAYAPLTVGISLFAFAFIYPLLWLFRFALTLNRPIVLVERRKGSDALN